jgi:predicted MFS family arabinose efflux permease
LFSANYLVIIVLAREHGASPATIGLIFAIGGAGGLLGALLAGVFASRLSLAAVVLGVNWLWTVLWPAFAVASNPLLLGLVWAIAVFAGPFWNVVLGSYSQSIIPDHLQARVGSVETLIAWGVIPLGSAISGILLQTIGPIPSLYVLGAGMLAIALAGTISPSIRHAPPLTRAPAN